MLNDGKIDPDLLDDLRKMLRGNLTARALLFSRAVLLVEGETELGALPVWCTDLIRQDILFYDVRGNGSFLPPLKLIRHFAIPWAIIGDGEVLWDRKQKGPGHGPQDHVRKILAACDQSLPLIPPNPGESAEDFAQWKETLAACGIVKYPKE